MTELSFEKYMDTFQSLIRRKLSLGKTKIHRGFDTSGNLLYIDGKDDTKLILPTVIIDVFSRARSLETDISRLKQVIDNTILEAIRTGVLSDMDLTVLKDRQLVLHSLQVEYEQCADFLHRSESNVEDSLLRLEKQLLEARDRIKQLNIDKENTMKSENPVAFETAAREYARRNSDILALTRQIDDLYRSENRGERYIISKPAVLEKRPLKLADIEVTVA